MIRQFLATTVENLRSFFSAFSGGSRTDSDRRSPEHQPPAALPRPPRRLPPPRPTITSEPGATAPTSPVVQMQRRRLRTAGLLPAPVEPASDLEPDDESEAMQEAASEDAETVPVEPSRPDEDAPPATFSRPRLPHTFPTQSVPLPPPLAPPIDQAARDEAIGDKAKKDAPPSHAEGSNGAGPPLTELHALVESLLFVSGEPVAATQLARALEVDEETIASALRTLAAVYASHNRGLRVQMHRNKYQIVTAPAAAPHIERFLNLDTSSKLSGPALETLAVIAYRQPVTRSQIEAVRGVDCAAVLRSLTQRGLVEEVGRLDVVGRPILYGVTDFFLQHFGLTDLEELPPLEQDEADTLWASTALADLPETNTSDEARDEDRQQSPNPPTETPIHAQDTSG